MCYVTIKFNNRSVLSRHNNNRPPECPYSEEAGTANEDSWLRHTYTYTDIRV